MYWFPENGLEWDKKNPQRQNNYLQRTCDKDRKAYSAVANACNKNPLLEIIPCQRVIRGDGKMGGYMGRKGVKGKLRLLESEGAKLNLNSKSEHT